MKREILYLSGIEQKRILFNFFLSFLGWIYLLFNKDMNFTKYLSLVVIFGILILGNSISVDANSDFKNNIETNQDQKNLISKNRLLQIIVSNDIKV